MGRALCTACPRRPQCLHTTRVLRAVLVFRGIEAVGFLGVLGVKGGGEVRVVVSMALVKSGLVKGGLYSKWSGSH